MFMFPPRKWLRHTAMVPKGFLRYQVLEALNEKPMSGSEIIEKIGKCTCGFWKPSPGSVYPLLAWLQDNGYIKELPIENGMKRYELTQNGKAFLEEQKSIRKKFREQAGFFPAPFFDAFFTRMPPEKSVEIYGAIRKLAIALFKVGSTLQEKFSEQVLNESLSIVNETSRKLEEIYEKLRCEQHE